MKRSIFFTITIMLLTMTAMAQVPEKALDISPLLIGESLTNVSLQNDKGQSVQLFDVLKAKPTVLVFYRGGWCPYCSVQLASIAEAEADILKLGYQIVAVSPDHYSQLTPAAEAGKVNYTLLADTNGELIEAAGIAFKTPEQAKPFIESKSNNPASGILPVPTVMILDTSGKILFEYINPDYKTRISSELLLGALKAL